VVQVSWSHFAIKDLDGIRRYVEQFNAPAALRLAERLVTLGNSLSEFPARGTPVAGGLRQMSTVRPYILTYNFDGARVKILAIRHGARLADEDHAENK
jgi:toxin ParE1/3/4